MVAVVLNVTIVRVFGTHYWRSILTLRSFNASFVSEFKVFDHSSAWKPFLYLKARFLPAVCTGSLRSRARKATCNLLCS